MTNIIAISGKIGSGKDTIGEIIQYFSCGADEANISFDVWDRKPVWGTEQNKFHVSSWEIKKMAGKLKDVACLILGCTKEQLEDRDFKESTLGEEWWYWSGFDGRPQFIPYESRKTNPGIGWVLEKLTVRKFLQLLGTDAGREVLHPNIWVNAFWSDYRPLDPEKASSFGNTLDYSDCTFPNWIITDCRFPNEAQSIKDRGGIIIRTERNNPNPNNHPSETGLDDYKDFDYHIDNNGSMEDLIEQVRIILIKEGII